MLQRIAFNLGDRASFEAQKGRLLGTLVKYNRKTVTVVTDNGQRWNISPHLLASVNDVGPAQPSAPDNKKRPK